jgi:hypothetical protein
MRCLRADIVLPTYHGTVQPMATRREVCPAGSTAYSRSSKLFSKSAGTILTDVFGSEQHGTGSDRRVAAGRPPPGGPVRSTGKNTRSSRVTSALRAFVLYGKNAIVTANSIVRDGSGSQGAELSP